MIQALQAMSCDGAVKNAAYAFLKKDLSTVVWEEDLKAAYHGLACAQQLLACQNEQYRKALSEMRKTLDAIARIARMNERRFNQLINWWKEYHKYMGPAGQQKAADALVRMIERWR
ncbi:MAG: hypothetical protein FJ118_20560 [Deltaproteobacteria bacterium]|nr:hypothetical protein [Deltaproteobacteria bacterium]